MLSEDAPARWTRKWFERWHSGPVDALVLAVGRTVTSTVRLLEIIRLFEGTGVVFVWTFDPGTAFGTGAEEMVREGRMVVVPWEHRDQVECDVVITASENVDVGAIRAPVEVFGHGIGFNRWVPDSVTGGERLSGVVPVRHLATHEITMIVSHEEQIDQLRPTYPEAAERCVVLGDPTYDWLVASRYRRHRYRRVLGVDGRRLVVVTSTWTRDGIYRSRPDLFRQLLAELPYDEYCVAVILHPNLSFSGEDHLDRTLTDALDAGLIVIPRGEGWHATLLAADLVIGDLGSVALYAVAIDVPFIRGVGSSAFVPGTPPEDLTRRTAVLSPDLPLREQVEAAIAGHRPGQYAAITDRLFSYRGEAAERVRRHLLDRLGLPIPDHPAQRNTVPEPHPRVRTPQSFTVMTRQDEPGHIEVVRFPRAATGGERIAPPGARSHSSASEAESLDTRDASVVLDPDPARLPSAEAWIRDCLEERPARIAAAVLDDGLLLGVRDGRRFLLAAQPTSDPGLMTAGAYELLRTGRLNTATVTVVAGGTTFTLSLERRPDEPPSWTEPSRAE